MLARDEVLRLQLFAAAWREVHAEVGQAFVPGTRDAHLLRTVFGRMPGERMQVSGCELGIEERRLHLCRSARFHFAFDPDLGGPVVLPVGKEADAVPASENVVQVLFEMVQWKVFVDSLRYLECGLDFESHSC